MKDFIKKWYIVIIVLILFFIPFFWFRSGEIDYGGDSTRLYFYRPDLWLKNIALYSNNAFIAMGAEAPSFFIIPFLVFLQIIKDLVLGKPYYLNNVFNGLLLSGSFVFIYLIVKELLLLKGKDVKYQLPAIIAGLFFCLSPIQIYEWQKALYNFNQILVFPMVFYFILKFINSEKWRFLYLGVFTTFVFSVNFSYNTGPWVIAFILFTFPFLFFYSLIVKKFKLFLLGSFVFNFLFILVNSFHLIPLVSGFLGGNTLAYQSVFESGTENINLSYFLSVQPFVRLVYNFTNQPQYYLSLCFGHPQRALMYLYGIKYHFLFFAFPAIICLGFLLKKNLSEKWKKMSVILLLFFLAIAFLMTANITTFGLTLYKALFSLPGFGMFRSFYTKFALVFVFFFALLLGCCLSTVLDRIKVFFRGVLFLLLVSILVLSGWPLISGGIVNEVIWQSENVRIPTAMDPVFESLLGEVEGIRFDSKITSLPWTNEQYQVLQGRYGGAYFGPSALTFTIGKADFDGGYSFSTFWPTVQKLVEKKDYFGINKIFNLLNITHIFHNRDPYIYTNFKGYPYADWYKNLFPTQESIKNFVDLLGYKKIYSIGYFDLYKTGVQILPHFYVSKNNFYSNTEIGSLPEFLEMNNDEERVAVYLKNALANITEDQRTKLKSISDTYFVSAEEVEKINPQMDEPDYSNTPKPISDFDYFKKFANEFSTEISLFREPAKLLDTELYFASRRINEIRTVEENKKKEKELFANYKRKMAKVLQIFDKLQGQQKTRMAWKILNFLESNSFMLAQSNIADRKLWRTEIKENLAKVDQFIPKVDLSNRAYSLDIPDDGEYFLFVDNSIYSGGNLAFSVTIDGNTVLPDPEVAESSEKGVVKWTTIKLSKGKHSVGLSDSKTDIVQTGSWTRADLGANIVFEKEIFQWQPGTWYQVKGESKDDNKTIELYISEKLKDGTTKKSKYADLFTYKKNFISFLYTDINPVSAKVEIFVDKNFGNTEDISSVLSSLKIEPIPFPSVFIRPVVFTSKVNTIPTIAFQKINKSKYLINVENANEPYNLVFSESFDKKWKIFLNDSPISDKDNLVASHFNGEIKEIEHKNILFDKNFITNFSNNPIVENSHFMVNGYANSWYISPEDVGNKSAYSLTVEFVAQRYFYYGAAISIFGLFILTVLLVLSLVFKK